MMTLLIVLILTLALVFFAIPTFESVFFILLSTPVVAYCIGSIGTWGVTALLIILAQLGLVFLWAWRTSTAFRRPSAEELLPIAVWFGAYLFFLAFTYRWPDFISIGERLRDYSLLSSVIQYPVEAREPWMAGATLNYYLYWYRFGQFLHSLGGLPTWAVYHQLQCFTMALYVAAFFRIFSKHLQFSTRMALLCSALIAIGSNMAGVWHFISGSNNWWGPSRVITGAIHEFPAWSFLLGDLHPHYLNLPLVPFALVLWLMLAPVLIKNVVMPIRIICAALAAALLVIWTYNSNAWEVAPLFILLVSIGTMLCGPLLKTDKEQSYSSYKTVVTPVLIILILSIALFLSSRNISPPDTPIRFVTLPFGLGAIEGPLLALAKSLGINLQGSVAAASGTKVSLLLAHFGLPLVLIALSSALLLSTPLERVLALVVITLAGISGNTLVFLLFIVVFMIGAALSSKELSGPNSGIARRLMWGVGVGSVLMIVFPEVFFFDDPYGGENERMNTIFKFYSAAWGLIHLFAFYIFSRIFVRFAWLGTTPQFVKVAILFVAAVALVGFFGVTVNDRSSRNLAVEPYLQGLSTVDREFRGSAEIIKTLSTAPKGTVLEAQGGPYSYTTFVSTLAGQEAFLGWINHMNLLLKNTPEIGRRDELTKKFYSPISCDERLKIAQAEKIRYVVFGTLEKRAYRGLSPADFSCFREIKTAKEYALYETPGI